MWFCDIVKCLGAALPSILLEQVLGFYMASLIETQYSRFKTDEIAPVAQKSSAKQYMYVAVAGTTTGACTFVIS